MKWHLAAPKAPNESRSATERLIGELRSFRGMPIPVWIDPLPAILFALGMLWWTWGKWPDIFIDFGRELYVPWQLSLGKVLYLDIAYFNGPLSPYFNSLWFRAFGPHLAVLVFINTAVLFLLIILVYTLARRISNRSGAVAASLVFVTVFAFGDYYDVANFNYICPYSHEMIHGILLSFMALLWTMIYCDTMQIKALCVSGLLTGLVFLTKVEIFLALLCAIIAALLAAFLLNRTLIATSLRAVLSLFASALLPPLVATLSVIPALGPVRALRGVAGSFYYLCMDDKVTKLSFYKWVMGTDHVGHSLARMLSSAAATAAFLAGAAAMGIIFRYSRRHRNPVFPTSVIVLCTVVLGLVFRTNWLSSISRAFPLTMVIIGIVFMMSLIRLFRLGRVDKRPVQQLSFVVFALVLLCKMILNTRIGGYGFVLAMPAALVVTVLMVDWLPGWVSSKGGFGWVSRAAGIAILLVMAGQSIYSTGAHLAGKTVWVSNGSDAFLAYPRGVVVNEGIAALKSIMKPGETMAVVPEGVMLNYLIRVENPTPYSSFMPPEVSMFGEENIVAAFKAHQPDYIVEAPRALSDYGFEGFGKGYASDLVSWIDDNYEELKTFSPESTREIASGKLTILRRIRP